MFDLTAITSLLEKSIDEHMGAQPYKITCAKCGLDITHERSLDSDMDLLVVVSICSCAQERIDKLETQLVKLEEATQ